MVLSTFQVSHVCVVHGLLRRSISITIMSTK
ncbi:hypothetical protein PHET_10445 [Paragonimus heterotremus]|uniref:Uncharacterized protein n=1 Tax=Paragonimus heterotremus TaxID=100268 RepID=A0A8J4WTS4_9TREM|nr:hypothetical protein PHET_10445 [Paragonimus heterotremus]